MVELGVLLCESFTKENAPVNGATIVVATAHRLVDIIGNIKGITEMDKKASTDLKKPLFCGITLVVEGEEFIAGAKEGDAMKLSEESILGGISFITIKLFDDMVVLTTDPVDALLKKVGITKVGITGNDYSGNQNGWG